MAECVNLLALAGRGVTRPIFPYAIALPRKEGRNRYPWLREVTWGRNLASSALAAWGWTPSEAAIFSSSPPPSAWPTWLALTG